MNKALKKLSGNGLKAIALAFMIVDHIGVCYESVLPSAYYGVCRNIGRLAFPIYAFLLVEGCVNTSNVKKYASRLLLFAFVSEVPFDLVEFGQIWNFTRQNVFFTLAVSVFTLLVWEKAKAVSKVSGIAIVFVISIASEILCFDYGAFGVLAIWIMYLIRKSKLKAFEHVAGALLFMWEFPAPLAFLITLLYNGKRGKKNAKYLFYFSYPVHLALLYVSKFFIVGA